MKFGETCLKKLVVQKTVGNNVPHLQQRQPTLGELTLEEILARTRVVRELDTHPMTRPSNNGIYGESQPNNNTPGLTLGFQQLAHNNIVAGNRIPDNKNSMPNQSSKCKWSKIFSATVASSKFPQASHFEFCLFYAFSKQYSNGKPGDAERKCI